MEGSTLPAAVCLFEDSRFPNFFPLSLNRPVFDVSIGTSTLRRRLVSELDHETLILLCRPYLAPVLREHEKPESEEKQVLVNEMVEGEIIFLNGRLLAYEDELEELLAGIETEGVIGKNGIPVAARLSGERASGFFEFLSGPISDEQMVRVIREIKEGSGTASSVEEVLEESKRARGVGETLGEWAERNGVPISETGVCLIAHYWQLIDENGKCIIDDFKKSPLRGQSPESELFKGVNLINEDDIVIGSEVEVRSGTVLDASEGPIIVADQVQIEPNAIIYGPCFIGEGTIVRGGAKIGHCTTLGKQSRIGGEVEETVFASYSNKQHEGFLGHSYIGSWVNIGAGSCNSDLKNNYSKVRAWSAGRIRDTGRRFLGVLVGDHAKIAINTRINTGTVVGFNANVMTTGFPPKLVPSFTWALEPDFSEYELNKALETAKIMMDRRNVTFTESLGNLFKDISKFCRKSTYTI